MGKLFKSKLKTGAEATIATLVIVAGLAFTYWKSPGMQVMMSKQLTSLELSSDNLNNITPGAKIPTPKAEVSAKVAGNGLVRIVEYAWNGNSGMIAANGGPRTTQGSLMEAAGVNLEIVRKDGVSDIRNMLIKFVEEYNAGKEYPESDMAAAMASIMADGNPFFISTTQEAIDKKFGKGKYHVQMIAPIGLSYGEDKLIGPKMWQDNPQTMRGKVISSVVGDGDYILALNFCFANKIPVNPDVTTYDSMAVNFVPSENDDYINSVKELIKSQKTGFTVPLKEVVNGKLTGKTINHRIDGATTWTPGDTLAFGQLSGFTDVVSTKDFVNQMATGIVTIKEWALQHEKIITAMLKQSYVAANQIKQYDEWAVEASEDVCATYGIGTPNYWYRMFKGQKGTKDGLDYNIGGTHVFNYADALQYFGISDGKNRYKAVYNQVSTYLTELNPCGFNQMVPDGVVQYEDAVNLYFLKSISDIDAGKTEKADYTATKNKVMASGNWNINFNTGSTDIAGSEKDLETIYNLLLQAEDTKLKVVGHTDNTGNPSANLVLSKGRANSVVAYLTAKGIPANRFQLVDGAGDTQPIASNKTADGKAKNRRVDITLLN